MQSGRRHYLVIQPYGAAIVDGESGKVDFLNESATRITEGVIRGRSFEDIATSLCDEFEVTHQEALADVRELTAAAPHLQDGKLGRGFVVCGDPSRTSIVQADLELTLACQLRCSYCFAEAGNPDAQELNGQDWIRVARWLLAQGLRQATLTGGEPLLSEAAVPLLEILSSHAICVQLFTNGLCLDRGFVSRLKDMSINFVQVSLDADEEGLHDRHRGHSHTAAKSAIRLLTGAGIPTLIGASIFPDGLNEVAKLAGFAFSVGCRLRCSPIDARGRARTFSHKRYDGDFRDAVSTAIQDAAVRFPGVFLDQDEDETCVDDEFHCKFFHGMIAVGSDGCIRPCLESKSFFQQVAPWTVDSRRAWELSSLEEHKAFATIAGIDQRYRPGINICGECPRFRFCQGCLLAGYSCSVREEVIV